MAYPKEVSAHAVKVVLTDFTGEPREITLDTRLNPVENAQALYEKAKKTGGEARGGRRP